MANLHRLIAALLFYFTFLFAHAATTVAPSSVYVTAAANNQIFNSLSSFCEFAQSEFPNTPVVSQSDTGSYWRCDFQSGNYLQAGKQYICPQYTTYNAAGACDIPVCPNGQIFNLQTGSCSETPPLSNCQKGAFKAFYRDTSDFTAFTGCDNGCVVEFESSGGQAPNFWAVSDYKTGETCTGQINATGTGAPATVTEESCIKQGKGFSTINGVTVCASAPSKTNNTTTSTSTTGGSTNTTTTNTTTTNNNNGTVTTTTTTNVTNNNGTPITTTDTKTEDTKSFCDKNPSSQVCKEAKEGKFIGGCSAGFSCEGDAVQCAIAKEQHRRNCELFEKETDLSTLGKNLANGNDPLASQNPTNGSNILNFNVNGQLDQSNPFSESGLSDYNVAFRGQTIVLPFSNYNEALELMGKIIVFTSLIIGARILYGGVQ